MHQYFIGRSKGELGATDPNQTAIELFFIGENADRKQLTGFKFDRCTFADIGAKAASMQNVQFINCVFLDVYLNQATFRNCTFVGCKFFHSSFTMAQFDDTVFRYCRFYDCALDYTQARNVVPDNPSDAYRFLRNLFEENRKIGHWSSAEKIVVDSIAQQETHWYRIFTGANRHYQDKYRGTQRVHYFFRWISSRLSRWLWGYGLSPRKVIQNLFFFLLLYIPVIYLSSSYFTDRSIANMFLNFDGLIAAGMQVSLPFAELESRFSAKEIIAGLPYFVELIGSIIGLIFFGIFIAILSNYVKKY